MCIHFSSSYMRAHTHHTKTAQKGIIEAQENGYTRHTKISKCKSSFFFSLHLLNASSPPDRISFSSWQMIWDGTMCPIMVAHRFQLQIWIDSLVQAYAWVLITSIPYVHRRERRWCQEEAWCIREFRHRTEMVTTRQVSIYRTRYFRNVSLSLSRSV